MSNEGMSYVTAAFVVAAGSLFFSQSALAGGDIIPPKDYEQPQRVQTWTPKRTWSGFYVGGGLGIQQYKTDVSVDSKNNFKKISTSKLCTLSEVTKTVWDKVTKKKWRKVTKIVKPRCGKPYTKTYKVPYTETTYKKTTKIDTVESCTCEETKVEDNFDFSHTESVNSEWNAFGTVMIGLDRQLSNRVVAGVFANVDFGSSETNFGLNAHSGDYSANISGNFKSDYSATVGARLGYLLNEKTLAYGLVGYTHTALSGSVAGNISSSDPAFGNLNMSKKFKENVGGLTLGVGAERKLNSNWFARLEYRYTWLGDIEAKLSGNSSSVSDAYNEYCKAHEWTADMNSETSVNFDPNLHSVRAVVTYKFNQ